MTTTQNGVRRVLINAGAATEFFPASARMFFQSSVDCAVYGSNNPSAGSEIVGSVVAGTASAIETGYAYISLSSAASGDCSISYVSAGAAATGGGGGGGGAVTIADGADITQGAKGQTAATDDTGSWSLVQLTKRLLSKTAALINGRAPVDTDRVAKQLIDQASSTVTYVCEASSVSAATSAASWRIKRITVSGNITTIQWGGTGAFDQIADNRATTVVYA